MIARNSANSALQCKQTILISSQRENSGIHLPYENLCPHNKSRVYIEVNALVGGALCGTFNLYNFH